MASSKDTGLYGIQRNTKLGGGKEISSSSSLAFTSQLSSLIATNSSSNKNESRSRIGKKPKKDNIFSAHNRGIDKRARKDLEGSAAFALPKQDATAPLDRAIWERSQRKMEEKSRLYAAMKRGDVEDVDDRYAIDFDRKWAEASRDGHDDELEEVDESDAGSDVGMGGKGGDLHNKTIEFIDEFGRTRTGSAADAARAKRAVLGQEDLQGDRFTARPTAPVNVIYGDTIQHDAFNPDETRSALMEELAKKRDKSLTPPPAEHFDANREIRTKGTGFFQFSSDQEERERQMAELTRERNETERKRQERVDRLEDRKRQIQARRADLNERRGKRKADDFLNDLSAEMVTTSNRSATDLTRRIESAIADESNDP